MSEAQIIKSDDLTVASSVWIIKRHATGEVVWQKKGGAIGLMTDSDSYVAAFEAMFPLLVIRWGAGVYRLEAILEGSAVGRIANMAAFWEAPDYDTAQAARKEIAGGLMEPSFVTRTTHRDTTKLPIRTHNGNLQGDTQEQRIVVGAAGAQQKPGLPYGVLGAGNTVGSVGTPMVVPQGTHPKAAALAETKPGATPTPSDPEPQKTTHSKTAFEAGMKIITQALRGTLIKRQLDWADRMRNLGTIWHQRLRPEAFELLLGASAIEPLCGRFHVGKALHTEEVDPKLLFHMAGNSVGQKAYLRWMLCFQQIEFQILTTMERNGTAAEGPDIFSPDRVEALLSDLVYYAAQLYLVESGKLADAECKVPFEQASEVINRSCEFIAIKDADYGQAIRRYGVKGLMVRLFDKFSRYTTLAAREDRASKFESIEDTARDLLCYSLIFQAFWQEWTEGAEAKLGA